MRDFILNALFSIVFATLLTTAVMAGIDKEVARQEKVARYNCARYGNESADYCIIHNPPIVKEARR